ncbi:hypothetical protein CYMTET_52054, partial [Cymbomonas tetramitiformis]
TRLNLQPLVAAGTAAGVAAGFNVALAAVFFAVETGVLQPVIDRPEHKAPANASPSVAASAQHGYGGDSPKDKSPALTAAAVALAAVMATLVSSGIQEGQRLVTLPFYELGDANEQLPLFLLLGLACGGISVVISKCVRLSRAKFAQLSLTGALPGAKVEVQRARGLPAVVLPALGGFLVGALALAWRVAGGPETGGICAPTGFENLNTVIQPNYDSYPIFLLLELGAIKILATSISRGSGLVGGIYAPSLFIGATLGAAFGESAERLSEMLQQISWLDASWLPAVGDPITYALVGMAGVLAGVCRVPLTSALLIFELTSDYDLVLPLMAAVGISSWYATYADQQSELVMIPTIAQEVQRMDDGWRDAGEVQRSEGGSSSGAPGQGSGGSTEGMQPAAQLEKDLDDELCSLEETLCIDRTMMELEEDNPTQTAALIQSPDPELCELENSLCAAQDSIARSAERQVKEDTEDKSAL